MSDPSSAAVGVQPSTQPEPSSQAVASGGEPKSKRRQRFKKPKPAAAAAADAGAGADATAASGQQSQTADGQPSETGAQAKRGQGRGRKPKPKASPQQQQSQGIDYSQEVDDQADTPAAPTPVQYVTLDEHIAPAQSRPTIYILRGLPGAGKGVLCDAISKAALNSGHAFVVCSADDFFMRDGQYKFQASSLSRAHNACMNTFLRALSDRVHTIIVDNTSTQRWEYESYKLAAQIIHSDEQTADAAESPKTPLYDVKILEIHCPNKDVALRMAGRNQHGVQPDKELQMFKRFQADKYALLLEPQF